MVRRAATSERMSASPDSWRHQPYWYWGRAVFSGLLVDESKLDFCGRSQEASDRAEARTMRPPPSDRPATRFISAKDPSFG
jgi:hypothetical protein